MIDAIVVIKNHGFVQQDDLKVEMQSAKTFGVRMCVFATHMNKSVHPQGPMESREQQSMRPSEVIYFYVTQEVWCLQTAQATLYASLQWRVFHGSHL